MVTLRPVPADMQADDLSFLGQPLPAEIVRRLLPWCRAAGWADSVTARRCRALPSRGCTPPCTCRSRLMCVASGLRSSASSDGCISTGTSRYGTRSTVRRVVVRVAMTRLAHVCDGSIVFCGADAAQSTAGQCEHQRCCDCQVSRKRVRHFRINCVHVHVQYDFNKERIEWQKTHKSKQSRARMFNPRAAAVLAFVDFFCSLFVFTKMADVIVDVTRVNVSPNSCPLPEPLTIEIDYSLSSGLSDAFWSVSVWGRFVIGSEGKPFPLISLEAVCCRFRQ
jgi:hypothetical protein